MGSGQAITQGNRNPLLGKVAGAGIVFRLHDQQGTLIAERRTQTGASGAASVEIVKCVKKSPAKGY